MKKSRREIIEATFNVLGAATYILSCATLFHDFMLTHRVSDLFMLARRFLFALFFAARKIPPHGTNMSPRDWIVALCGSYLQNLLLPAPEVHDNIFVEAVQAVGLFFCIGGLLSLNDSFGIVAANRGIKTSGLYRIVRHPIYAGYFLESAAYLAQNFILTNLVIMVVWTLFQIRRITVEEEYLSKDPAYVEFKKKTRWRILPFVY